jgi:hypothetical protein
MDAESIRLEVILNQWFYPETSQLGTDILSGNAVATERVASTVHTFRSELVENLPHIVGVLSGKRSASYQ